MTIGREMFILVDGIQTVNLRCLKRPLYPLNPRPSLHFIPIKLILCKFLSTNENLMNFLSYHYVWTHFQTHLMLTKLGRSGVCETQSPSSMSMNILSHYVAFKDWSCGSSWKRKHDIRVFQTKRAEQTKRS